MTMMNNETLSSVCWGKKNSSFPPSLHILFLSLFADYLCRDGKLGEQLVRSLDLGQDQQFGRELSLRLK